MTRATGREARFFRETIALYATASTTEMSYYPVIRQLWAQLLEERGLPFEVRAETSERRSGGPGADHPDLALYDRGDFVAVLAEVKTPDVEIKEMAASTDRNDQVGRYLARTGVVLLCNVRAIGLLACKPGYHRTTGKPVPPAQRDLLGIVSLWPTETALKKGQPLATENLEALGDLLERAVTEFAHIADPLSLARILARLARRAKEDLPRQFNSVASLLDDYKRALGLTFDLETEKDAEFFRSSLIQTAYYGLFAGWTLWHRAQDRTAFQWDHMDRYLKIPFLGQLFYEFKHPDRLAELQLESHLDRATETLGRVDRGASSHASRIPLSSRAPTAEMFVRPPPSPTSMNPSSRRSTPISEKSWVSGTRLRRSSAIRSTRWIAFSGKSWAVHGASPILGS